MRVKKLQLAKAPLGIAIALLGLSCTREQPATAHHYNLLLITLDTLRADRVGAYGDPSAKTPVLDRVASEGVRFENAISAVPLTLPSHATILTGLLPPQHGLRNNGAGKLDATTPTLATILSAAGYRTGAFVGAFVLDRRFGLNRGFEIYDDDIPGTRRDEIRLEAERAATRVVDRAVEWLRKTDPRPAFAWVHLYDPHAPYAPPEPFRSGFPDDPYRGEIAYVDHQVGRLLDELDRRGMANRTVVVIVGDHGEALGEHGEGTHGLLLYESTLRVPLIVRAPNVLKPSVLAAPISLTDLAPTLASLLLAHRFTDSRVGSDLSSDLLARREPPDRILYCETEYPTLFGWSGLAAARRGSLKFIESPAPELYDLERDSAETRNLYGQERRAMQPLLTALRTLRSNAAQRPPARLDAETERKLASLGYVAPAGTAHTGNRANPSDVVTLFRRFEQATWDLHGGRPGEALVELETLVRTDSDNPVFRSTLARAHRQRGNLERAIELYRDAVALNPEDSEGWYNLAATFQEAGDQERAAEAIREAIRRDPSRPEAHNVLGIAYSASGKLREALEQFGRATELDPRNARAVNNQGNVFRSMKRLGDAEAAYRQAIRLDPGYADPWNGLGTLEVERGRPREAIQFFERALSLAPDAHEARLNRAVAFQLAGDLSAAEREYRSFLRAVEKNPAFADQRRAVQAMLQRLGRTR